MAISNFSTFYNVSLTFRNLCKLLLKVYMGLKATSQRNFRKLRCGHSQLSKVTFQRFRSCSQLSKVTFEGWARHAATIIAQLSVALA